MPQSATLMATWFIPQEAQSTTSIAAARKSSADFT
jgi:hypothetical protein